jgi:hypothetical protein
VIRAIFDTGAKPSPRQTPEIEHASTRCDPEIKHVGVSTTKAHAPLWLGHEDFTFKWVPTKRYIKGCVARFTK